ncbi:MAG: class I SAM-dependent methyltransferase [Acidimicrobiales bacterium]
MPSGDGPSYDRIGVTYTDHRRPDDRIAEAIHRELGATGPVVNVGAGAGSYEPVDRPVVAVEPSPVMIAQRPHGAAPCVQASAEHLPFADGAFDAALALLTVHHWADWRAGLAELRRVAPGRQVVFTWATDAQSHYWFIDEYMSYVTDVDDGYPTAPHIAAELPGSRIVELPVPADCTDGFFAAYWRRPEAYLDPGVRASISTFALGVLDPVRLDASLSRLAADLESGAWHERHRDLLELDQLDVGYRLVVAGR